MAAKTAAETVKALHFEIDGADISKVVDLMDRCNRELKKSLTVLENRGESIASGRVTSFVLDDIIDANAQMHVYTAVAHAIKSMIRLAEQRNSALDVDATINVVTELATENAVMAHHINSSSNVSVELDIRIKLVWGRLHRELRYM